MNELKKMGARLKAAGAAASEMADQAHGVEYDDPKNRTERLMRQFGQSAIGERLVSEEE